MALLNFLKNIIPSRTYNLTKPSPAVPNTAQKSNVATPTPSMNFSLGNLGNSGSTQSMAMPSISAMASPQAPASFSNPVIPQVKPVAAPIQAAPVSKPVVPMIPGSSSTSNAPVISPINAPSTNQNAPVVPTVTPEAQKAVDLAQKAYDQSLRLSPEELSTQEDLDKVIESTKKAYVNTEDQAIPMEFITGQLASIERRATGLAEPLQAKLARMQAARTSSLEASKFALTRADKEVDTERASAAKTASDAESARRFGIEQAGSQETRDLAQKKFDQDRKEFGLTYAQNQQKIANDKLATVQGKDLTVDQSKARQFAISAQNANAELGSSKYNLGSVELWRPNAFKSSDRQVFERAARAFVNASLRRESGATITDDEFLNKYAEVIPSAGDGADVIAQKKLARAASVKSIQEAGLLSSQQGPSESANPPTMVLNGQTLYLQADGTYQ